MLTNAKLLNILLFKFQILNNILSDLMINVFR